MRLKQIELRRFKRFTDTTVTDIPHTARLCIIAGPNGCGKSSLFEALNVWSRANRTLSWSETYHVKSPEEGIIPWNEAVKVTFHGGTPADQRKAIYIRSAYRNEPRFEMQSLPRIGSALDENRLPALIENDAAVGKNYQRLASQALEDLFDREPGTTTVDEFREKVVGDIQKATSRLFPELVLNGLGNPLTVGTFRFDKGNTKKFLYQNLSGGEKAAFDLLLDLIVKRREFDDTVFCIDEPEAHMSTRVQAKLLDELFSATGNSCQLWLATHSIGMMRRARDLARRSPGEVIFLDFGGRDFDTRQEVRPEKPTRAFWHRIIDVAFDDFAALIAPSEVIICEGSRFGSGGRSEGLDAKIYEAIFGSEFPETRFIPGGNSHEVENDRLALISAMQALMVGTKVRRLIDRDDMSDEGIDLKRSEGVTVLNRRHLESYLLDDEIIRLLAAKVGKPELGDDLVQGKLDEMSRACAERRRPPDDVKASAGPIIDSLKRKLTLIRSGNSVKEFMLVSLAPLIEPHTVVYQELRGAVFVADTH